MEGASADRGTVPRGTKFTCRAGWKVRADLAGNNFTTARDAPLPFTSENSGMEWEHGTQERSVPMLRAALLSVSISVAVALLAGCSASGEFNPVGKKSDEM